jgi:molybdopterin-containing oxidoreductase family membrane subunit
VSLLFWYLGLIPDLATSRDLSKPGSLREKVYGLAALGWRGSVHHWKNYRMAYLLLAGLATPLVLSVHSIVSFDFAISILPGWHTTIFPPYFVAGAIYSGFALVLTLMIPARRALGFEHVVTVGHIDNMSRVMLATGLMVTYGYIQEHFFAWYSGDTFEMAAYATRRIGPYAPVFWTQIFCNCLAPQLLWWGRMRTNLKVVWAIALLVNVGMWLERFSIIVVSLTQDFMPSSWRMYFPTWVDLGLFVGTLGVFSFFFLLFLKLVPPIAIHEAKELRDELLEEGFPRRDEA